MTRPSPSGPLTLLKAQAGKLIPFNIQQVVLEHLLQRVLKDSVASGQLDFLRGRWVRVVADDAGLDYFITLGFDSLVVRDGGVAADVTFRSDVRGFALLVSRRRDPDTLFFRRQLSVTGDTELGLQCKNLLDTLEWEQLPPRMRFALDKLGFILDRSH